MRALITGSAGFIGRHLDAALERDGWDVDRCDPRYAHGAGIAAAVLDCRTTFAPIVFGDLKPSTYDLVVHCAALVDGRESIEHKAALLGAYNLQLDGALFEWALRAKPGRVVYFSSSAAYPVDLQFDHGNTLRESMTERSFHSDPDQTYGWVKLTGERIASEVRKAGIPVTVVRPFSGYGEDQDDCYPFPAMIGRAARREDPFDVWGDGQQVRDFIHVDDVVAGTFALVEQEVDGPVNLGTGVGTSMDDLARLAMACAGYEAPIRHLADKPQGVSYRVADTKLMLRYFEPTVTLRQGVERALSAHRTKVAA